MATDTLVNILPDGECKQWFVMRDLTRSNAKCPAYVLLEKLGVEYFTPMVWKITIRNGQHKRKRVPYIHDLIFVHDSRKVIDPNSRTDSHFSVPLPSQCRWKTHDCP